MIIALLSPWENTPQVFCYRECICPIRPAAIPPSTPIHPQTTIGHIHLTVADLDQSVAFYRDLLGFEVTMRYGDSAVFLSAGGYHHHLGLNTWAGKGASPPPPGHTRLYHFAILYPNRQELAKALYTAKEHGWHRFVSMQNRYNLIYREEEREMIPLCIDQGVTLIPWSPLARGFLEGDRTREPGARPTKRAQTDQVARNLYFHDNDYEVAAAVQKIAKERGVTPMQLACAWVLQAPGVTAPILGATKTHHLKQVFAAVDIKLSAEEVATMEAPYRPHPIVGYEHPKPRKMVK